MDTERNAGGTPALLCCKAGDFRITAAKILVSNFTLKFERRCVKNTIISILILGLAINSYAGAAGHMDECRHLTLWKFLLHGLRERLLRGDFHNAA
jgi:hypothetical protein